MPSELINQMRAALRAERSAETQALSLAERRARFEDHALRLPVPPNIAVEAVRLSGVSCDILTPEENNGGVLLYIHGGGFCVGSPRSHRSLAARIARAAGMRAVLPDYRLAPEHPFPAAPDDVFAVYRHIADQWSEAPAAIAGDSAGGCLALAALFDIRDSGLPPPRACALISPCADLSMSGASIIERKDVDPFLAPDRLRAMFNAYAGAADFSNPRLSPLFGGYEGLPPMLIEAGTDEILYDDAVALAERARAAGVDATLNIADGLFHVYHAFAPAPEAIEGAERIGAFLKSRLQKRWRTASLTDSRPPDRRSAG